MPWKLLFLIILAGFVWLLDKGIDPYPPPLQKSNKPVRDFGIVCILWVVALVVNALRIQLIDPYLTKVAIQPALRELIYIPVITLPLLALPMYLSLKIDHYRKTELGLTWKNSSMGVTIFALSFGAISGAIAYWTDETVVGITSLSAGALLLLIYNNAFIEEFFYRGVIQNRLERVINQRWAVMVAGVLFALSHALLDYRVLASSGGLISILYALLMQVLAGWLLGLIFLKTRTLWPSIACHYLINWMPSIMILLIGDRV